MTDTTKSHLDVERVAAELDERGYHLLEGVILPEDADAARAALEPLLAAEITEDEREKRTQRVGEIAVKDRVFLDLMCHPTIVAFWKHYLGDDVICSTWTANTVYPGHDTIRWHSDYPYWSITPPWPDGRLAGQTIWLLDDFTEENGGTGVVPGSHRAGHPPPEPRDIWRADGEILTGTRGTVVLGHGAWWHTARPNRSDKPRSCLLGMYMRPCVIPQEDMADQLARIDDADEVARQLMGASVYRPRNIGSEKRAAATQ